MKQRSNRIFWLGMHKILRPTELMQLRQMGYEVFSPEYISPIYDQSADLTSQRDQATTLPKDIFLRLIEYDFFYRNIDVDISQILNHYFDVVIVTINPDWLISIMDAYQGKIIYRIYGQPYSLSNHFVVNGTWQRLIDRRDFYVVPFANESVQDEQRWFRELCTEAVPYQIPDDVFERSKDNIVARRPEIAVSIPNIANQYYGQAYHLFVRDYPDSFFRVYGPQRELPADSRVIGGLERSRYLDRLQQSAGYLYIYRDNVCYLPPIECMQLGRPVVFLPGSLLAAFSDNNNPGAASNIEEARRLCSRLTAGDDKLAQEIIAAQETVRLRYDRDEVRPQFERTMRRLIEEPKKEQVATALISSRKGMMDRVFAGVRSKRDQRPLVVIPLHVDGLFHYIDGQPVALEGIPRVVDAIVDTLVSHSNVEILVSCSHGGHAVTYDFFREHISSGRLSVFSFSQFSTRSAADLNFERLKFLNQLAMLKERIVSIFVPHYYLFPEFAMTSSTLTLYLPDYFPHLMPDTIFDSSTTKDAINKSVGKMLAQKASRILTNSHFTKNYLPHTGLLDQSQSKKIVVAPLPFLGSRRAASLTVQGRQRIEGSLRGRDFIFYPTANRPNKQLAFFMRVLSYVRLTKPNLCAVLTCDLNSVPAVAEEADRYMLRDSLVMLPGSTEDMMRWLYENCCALVLTSTAEGNFPPQILEALNYGAPVVATRLPTIEEIARDKADLLLLCDALDLTSFADALEIAIEDRTLVLQRQGELLLSMKQWNSADAFARSLANAFPSVTFV